MIAIEIDGKRVEVAVGSTVLAAAKALDIEIPTMCFRSDCTPFTSCMICVVKNLATGKLIPSCSAPVQEGMRIETDSEELRKVRRTTLELLLSDHVGDCEGPCHRVCPKRINIPVMLRHILEGAYDAAGLVVARAAGSEDPCEGCAGPCEKACRRRQKDAAVSIRAAVAFARTYGSGSVVVEPEDRKPFNCSMGRLLEGELDVFMAQASADGRVEPAGGETCGFTGEEAKLESARCLHCDCRKAEACRLRSLSDRYEARQRRYKVEQRHRFVQVRQHGRVVYEPEKCIKCGLCVQITERETAAVGLTFVGRGFDVRVGVPFDESLDAALHETAAACVAACPTAALAMEGGGHAES